MVTSGIGCKASPARCSLAGYVLLYPLGGPKPEPPVELTGHRRAVLNRVSDRREHRPASSGEDELVNAWNFDKLS